jgi:HEAT repeat protein
MEELQRDEGYRAWRQEAQDREQFHREDFREAVAPLLAELAESGLPIQRLDELLQLGPEYRRALPILLRWLPRASDPSAKEAVVKVLSVPWAKPLAAPVLIDEFKRLPDDTGTGLRWTIGNALAIVADDEVFDDIVALLRDRRYGRAREMLALSLGNVRDPRAVDVLIELLQDDDVAGHAVIALGELRASRAVTYVEQLLSHPKAWVRKEARKALVKMAEGDE